jgi:DNA-binding NarL/FixJ family response regulator
MAGASRRAERLVRVVLADDASEMRSLLRWALEREDGVQVVGEASDPRQAMDLAAELVPDALVLDLQMPGMTPAALIEAVAAAAPAVPIVTFSGYEPGLVAPEQAHLVRLHVPKTTDLALVREAIVRVAREPA